MFGKLPKTLVMSEPGALNYIHRLYNQGQFTWTEYERLIQSCTKLQFKPTRQTKTDRYVLNSQYLCVHLQCIILDGSENSWMVLLTPKFLWTVNKISREGN